MVEQSEEIPIFAHDNRFCIAGSLEYFRILRSEKMEVMDGVGLNVKRFPYPWSQGRRKLCIDPLAGC